MSIAHGGMNPRTSAKAEPKGKKEIDHLAVSEAVNGGHTVTHHFQGFEHPPEGPHVFAASDQVVEVPEGHVLHHIAKHLNIPHTVIGADDPEEEQLEEKIAPGIHAKVTKAEAAE